MSQVCYSWNHQPFRYWQTDAVYLISITIYFLTSYVALYCICCTRNINRTNLTLLKPWLSHLITMHGILCSTSLYSFSYIETNLIFEEYCLQLCFQHFLQDLVQNTQSANHSLQELKCHLVLIWMKGHVFQIQPQTQLWRYPLVHKWRRMLICVQEYTHSSRPLSRWWFQSCFQ